MSRGVIKLPKCIHQASGRAKHHPSQSESGAWCLWSLPLGYTAHSCMSLSFCWVGNFDGKFSASSTFVFTVLHIWGPQHCSTLFFK